MENRLEKKTIIKRCAGVIGFCLILLLVLGRVYKILSWKDSAGGYFTPVETFYGLDEDMVDVLFLGSSHCYCSIISSRLWDDYGIAGCSLSISGQDFASSYYWLKEALKTQKPKVVCLEMYYAGFHGYLIEGNLYRNILPYHISSNYMQMVRDMTDEESGSLQTEAGIVDEGDRSSFLAKWPVIHTRYRELQRQDFTGPDILYMGFSALIDGMHQSPITWTTDGSEPYEGDEILEIEEEKWLRKIIELTKANDIELCLFLAPMTVSREDQMRMNYVGALAEEEGIPFLNFVDLREEVKIDPQQDFLDGGHVNYRGGAKVTDAIGRFLVQNYTMEDHRGDKKYELWEQNSAFREHEFNAFKLQESVDLQYILDCAAYASDYTVILSTEGDYFRETDYLADRLMPLGIGEEFENGGGIWIIEDGQVTWKTNAETGDWYLEPDGTDIVLFRSEGTSRIFVNQQDCTKVPDGIHIVIYDKLLKNVVYAAGFAAGDGYTCVK